VAPQTHAGLRLLVFFFIGAPLGAIIRKGWHGLPVVFAIIFFLIFHIISFSTENW
jgi:lipopolysaccharide export system permease protein